MTQTALAHMVAGDGTITFIHENKTYTVDPTHVNYQTVRDALSEQRWDDLVAAATPAQMIRNYLRQGDIEVNIDTGQVTYQGFPINGACVQHILSLHREGLPVTSLVNFLNRLYKNPSATAVEELYQWIEATRLVLTEDGHIVAYKKVKRGDNGSLVDIYTGKIPNDPGCQPSMPRYQVDDRRDNTCSSGLHFCSEKYLPHFGTDHGNVVVLIKIDPADVVSIPSDYNNAKGRCCRYTVLQVYSELNDEQFQPIQSSVWAGPVTPISVSNIYEEIFDDDTWGRRRWGPFDFETYEERLDSATEHVYNTYDLVDANSMAWVPLAEAAEILCMSEQEIQESISRAETYHRFFNGCQQILLETDEVIEWYVGNDC